MHVRVSLVHVHPTEIVIRHGRRPADGTFVARVGSYRIARRLTYGERRLLDINVDDDVSRLCAMRKAALPRRNCVGGHRG
jgi:hypothetical protein